MQYFAPYIIFCVVFHIFFAFFAIFCTTCRNRLSVRPDRQFLHFLGGKFHENGRFAPLNGRNSILVVNANLGCLLNITKINIFKFLSTWTIDFFRHQPQSINYPFMYLRITVLLVRRTIDDCARVRVRVGFANSRKVLPTTQV